jgi:hypothetical protein
MQFFLKTGFGIAKESYRDTIYSPYMGLTQGSEAAPAAWTAISIVIVSACKCQGYSGHLASRWSGIFFIFAAILYINDTDPLHTMKPHDTSGESFVCNVQDATYFWAMVLLATGGNLKPT